MKEKTRILKDLIGARIEYIGFIELQHEPIPNLNSKYITHKSVGMMNTGFNGWNKVVEIKSIFEEFENHTNPYKIEISQVSQENINNVAQSYKSLFKLEFEIAAIWEFEECQNSNHINEVKESSYIPSTLHIVDRTGIQNIIITSYEVPGEQNECELSIQFLIGNYASYSKELKLYPWSELKYINMYGKRTRHK